MIAEGRERFDAYLALYTLGERALAAQGEERSLLLTKFETRLCDYKRKYPCQHLWITLEHLLVELQLSTKTRLSVSG